MRRRSPDAIESGHLGGAALDVFENEPTKDHRLQKLPQVGEAHHISRPRREGQELVGVETASALSDYLKTGAIRNAVNFPSLCGGVCDVAALCQCRPQARVAARTDGRGAGRRVERPLLRRSRRRKSNPLIVSSIIEGLLREVLFTPVTPVNARQVAAERGIDVSESHSPRPRSYTSLLSG